MHHVLVVDDEPGIRDIVRLALARVDVGVAEAASGAAAMTVLETLSPDAVIVDLGLPDMNGLDVIRRIRETEPTVPIVLMSASTQTDLAADAVQVSAILEKPFKLQRLQQVILRALATPKRSGQEKLS